jgi:hypothetical protein
MRQIDRILDNIEGHPRSYDLAGTGKDARGFRAEGFRAVAEPGPSKGRPIGELVDIMDVGFACAYLATPLAKRSPVERSMSTEGSI